MAISELDIQGLPEPAIIDELDVEVIVTDMRNDLVAQFPSIASVIDLESEPARKLIEVCAYRELLLRQRINSAIRANLIAFAEGADLDHLSAFYDVIRMSDEDDDRLRTRTILAIQGRSPGGTRARYKYIVLSASTRASDAEIWSDDLDPTVNVAVYADDNNGVADTALLEIVSEALHADDVQMVNDTFNVQSAVQKVITIEAEVWLLPETAQSVFDDLETNLKADWISESGLGFDMVRSWINSRLMRPGIHSVEVIEPATDETIPYNEAGQIGTVTLTLKGRKH